MKVRVLSLVTALMCLSLAATATAQPGGGPGGAEDVINSYVENSFAEDLDGTLDLFKNSEETFFHINGIFYFTIDPDQGVFQVVTGQNYLDGWNTIHQGFSAYFDSLVEALSIKTTVRTSGNGMRAPLDGGPKIDGETNYVILARFFLDDQGNTGYAIVHGLDQFRIKNHKISNIINLEKTVFLSPQESAHLDSLTSSDAKISWGLNRACELKNSVLASIDVEKRDDIALDCP